MKSIENVVRTNNSNNSIEPQNVTNMENTNKNLPRPTAEVISEYERVESELRGLDPSWSDEEANAYLGKEYELETNYDWSNVEFTDPITGKKGLRGIKGELIVSAQYDAFSSPGSCVLDPWEPIIAILDGKYGLLSCKGDEEIYVPFEYEHIVYDFNRGGYIGRKGDQEGTIKMNDLDDTYNYEDLPF